MSLSLTDVPQIFSDFFFSQPGDLLMRDTRRWAKWRKYAEMDTTEGALTAFLQVFSVFEEFRSIVDHRVDVSRHFSQRYRLLPQFKRATNLYIACPAIGPGFIINHGFSTWLYAERVGSDFNINHNVTVGYDGKTGIPTIGDRVTIRTGAVVVGKITIGDDVHIGANAVVNFDVPNGSRVVSPRAIVLPPRSARPAQT